MFLRKAHVAPREGAANGIETLRDYIEKEEVEGWPDFLWPYYDGEQYLLTVVTPQRSWRLQFELFPKRFERDRPYFRLSQESYRELVDRFEATGEWKVQDN